jgi:hypothetical protein
MTGPDLARSRPISPDLLRSPPIHRPPPSASGLRPACAFPALPPSSRPVSISSHLPLPPQSSGVFQSVYVVIPGTGRVVEVLGNFVLPSLPPSHVRFSSTDQFCSPKRRRRAALAPSGGGGGVAGLAWDALGVDYSPGDADTNKTTMAGADPEAAVAFAVRRRPALVSAAPSLLSSLAVDPITPLAPLAPLPPTLGGAGAVPGRDRDPAAPRPDGGWTVRQARVGRVARPPPCAAPPPPPPPSTPAPALRRAYIACLPYLARSPPTLPRARGAAEWHVVEYKSADWVSIDGLRPAVPFNISQVTSPDLARSRPISPASLRPFASCSSPRTSRRCAGSAAMCTTSPSAG